MSLLIIHGRIVFLNMIGKHITICMSAALNYFLASVAFETPINEKMSFMFSGRISPLALEYRAVRGMLPDLLGGFDD